MEETHPKLQKVVEKVEKMALGKTFPGECTGDPEEDPSRSITGVEPSTPKSAPREDRIFRPNHYAKHELEPITSLIVNRVPFAEGNVIKYVMRWRDKNGVEDLRKAMRYLEMLIEFEEHKEDYLPKKKIL